MGRKGFSFGYPSRGYSRDGLEGDAFCSHCNGFLQGRFTAGQPHNVLAGLGFPDEDLIGSIEEPACNGTPDSVAPGNLQNSRINASVVHDEIGFLQLALSFDGEKLRVIR